MYTGIDLQCQILCKPVILRYVKIYENKTLKSTVNEKYFQMWRFYSKNELLSEHPRPQGPSKITTARIPGLVGLWWMQTKEETRRSQFLKLHGYTSTPKKPHSDSFCHCRTYLRRVL